MIIGADNFLELCSLCNKNPVEGVLTVEGDETWEGLKDDDGLMRWNVCKQCAKKALNR